MIGTVTEGKPCVTGGTNPVGSRGQTTNQPEHRQGLLHTSDEIKELQRRACCIRLHILRMVGAGKPGHFGGSCSCADVLAALYFSVMKVDPANPAWPGRDRFILSKGHAAMAQYAALAEAGYFSVSELSQVKHLGSRLQGHPDVTKTPGVEANTGSLGQGLSIANGLALAAKLDGLESRVYVLLGDGEINEGQVWEAAMFASFHRLDNVTAVLDRNSLQAMGWTKDRLNTAPLENKWRAFDWNVLEIEGHNMEEILAAFEQARQHRAQPTLIIANTVKGKGVACAENNPAFHNGTMTPDQFDSTLNDLETTLAALGVRP